MVAAPQPPHLLAALRLDDAEHALHQQRRVAPQAGLQPLLQHMAVRPEDAQRQQDAALRSLDLPPALLVDLLQPLLQPGAHGVQQVPPPSEKLCPQLGQDAAHGLRPGSALLGRGRAVVPIPAATRIACLSGVPDDAVQAILLPLREADGGDEPPAERAGSGSPQPAQDAAQAELVLAGQGMGDIPRHLAADGAAPLPPAAGHAAFWLPASALPSNLCGQGHNPPASEVRMGGRFVPSLAATQ